MTTAYVTATLQSLLMRHLAFSAAPASVRRPAPSVQRVPEPFDAAETMPMLFRSEGFAEDLIDMHPAN